MKSIIGILLIFTFIATSAQDLKIKEPVRFLALGDSYTIGESVPESGRWPVQLMDSLEARGYKTGTLKIIATTGWRTDNLKNAILEKDPLKDFNLVSLLIGVNDQYQGYDADWYEPRFSELLQMAIEFAGGDKSSVFVVSIPDYAYTPFGQQSNPAGITEDINSFNAINKTVTEGYKITYINITPISRQGLDKPGLVASDGLHPSELMYSQWVEIIMRELLVPEIVNSQQLIPEEDGISIYPNPFTDTVEFSFPNTGTKVEIAICNASGQIMMQLSSNKNNQIRFNTSSFEPGIYFYYILTSEGEFRGKLVKV